MLERTAKGKYKWKTDESERGAYSINDAAFILDQMDQKLDEIYWDILQVLFLLPQKLQFLLCRGDPIIFIFFRNGGKLWKLNESG